MDTLRILGGGYSPTFNYILPHVVLFLHDFPKKMKRKWEASTHFFPASLQDALAFRQICHALDLPSPDERALAGVSGPLRLVNAIFSLSSVSILE